MTRDQAGVKGEGMIFADEQEVARAYQNKAVRYSCPH